ncbi:MAG: hypothetical protein ACJ72W_18865 [Actinoallomurus sp.]
MAAVRRPKGRQATGHAAVGAPLPRNARPGGRGAYVREPVVRRPDGTFTVALYRWTTFGEIHVIDAGGLKESRLPQRDPVGAALADGADLPESGLGLYGIGALADQYGTYRHRDGSRVVWARLRFSRTSGSSGHL